MNVFNGTDNLHIVHTDVTLSEDVKGEYRACFACRVR